MTTLPERLQDVLAAMREASPQCAAFADRLESATALQGSGGEVVAETMISHAREPHCIGCYVIRWNDGDPVAVCGECSTEAKFSDYLAHGQEAVASASELVYGFAALLTCSDGSLTVGGSHDGRHPVTAALAGREAGEAGLA